MLNYSLTQRWLQVLTAWLAFTVLAMAQSNNLFTTLSLSPVASLPLAIASGDFNGDGITDIAVTSSGTNAVSILLGTGDGNSQPAVNYSAGIDPLAIVAADFNHDGHLDLAVVDSNPNTGGASGSVFILVGQGDGTFVAGNTYAVGLAPTAIALGDFNGDGNPDLAVAVSNPNLFLNPGYVAVLLGNPDATFQAQSNYTVGILPASVTTADFNGDGKLDLAVGSTVAGISNPQSEVSVLLNNGSGVFQGAINANVAQAGTVPISLVAADFNNDAKLDLAVALNNTSDLVILQGNEDGTLAAATVLQVGANPVWLAQADLNGDGKPDLVVANNADSTISVLLGNGNETFTSNATYPVGTHPTNLLLADLNGDGKLDLDVVNNGDSTAQVLLGEGDGSFRSATYRTGANPTDMVSGDFNQDGFADLAILNGDATVSIFLADGHGGFKSLAPFVACPTQGSTPPGPMRAGDLNNDGKLDLELVCYGQTNLEVLTGNGDGTFQNYTFFNMGQPIEGIAVADINGDGIAEVLFSIGSSVYAGSLFNPATLVFDGTTSPGRLATGDFNGDGNVDVAIASSQGLGWVVALGDGTGNFTTLGISESGDFPLVGDFNGDGLSDFVFSNSEISSHLQIANSNGDGTFSDTTKFAQIFADATADFNGDGIPDIVTANASFLSVLLGQEDETFIDSGTSGSQFAEPFPVAGDFDGNGSPDIAVLDVVAGTVSILLNTHTFQSTTTVLSESSSSVVVGQPLTLSAAVTSKQGTPTGAVAFKQAGIVQASGSLTAGQAQVTLPALNSGGQYGFTALYPGDETYSGSLSERVLVTVSPASSTTVVSSNTASVKLGQSVTFTATVVPQFSGTPSGTVEFYADGQPLGSATLNGAKAMFSTAALTLGLHKIEADYSGDGNFTTSLGIFKQNVGRAASTVTLTSSLNPAVYGQPITLTAVVTDSDGMVPTGSVVFAEGATVYGTIPLSAGVAQIALPVLTMGTHNIAAQYGGDSFDGPAKAVLAQVVNGAPSATTIASSAEPSSFGQSITFTALVTSSSGTPDGTVTIKNGSVALGTVTLSAGSAQLSVSTLNGGPHTITAVYSGSSVYARSGGSTAQIVEPAATATTITTSLNPSPTGQTVTFTAVVTAGSAPSPTGNVTFHDGQTVLGSAALVGGQAQFSTSTLSTGTHTITAVFNGSVNFVTSLGNLSQVIQ